MHARLCLASGAALAAAPAHVLVARAFPAARPAAPDLAAWGAGDGLALDAARDAS